MRNLKRALSLGLTAAMISGLMVMGSSAASSSYTDVADTDNVEAIEVLKAVGIMVGDDNGDFNPDENVSRNEMAVVMSNLMEYNVATYADTSPFTDVPDWAEPYVAACWTNGITAGYTDTTFGGDDDVTTAQAALMVMKALGYFQYESDFGSDWQLETISQGNTIDLFDGVESGVRDSMTRNDVAQLVLNALEAGTVTASTSGTISVGDITIVNDVEYNYVTSNQDYAQAISDLRPGSSTSSAETEYETEQEFSDDDIVLVTIGQDEIQSMAVAETVEGTVDAVRNDSYVRIDGTTYNYNRLYCIDLYNRMTGLTNLDDDGDDFVNPTTDNDVTVYLDAYGYAVAIEGADDSIEDYLYVVGIDQAYGDYSARVVFGDGTQETIDIDDVDGYNAAATGISSNGDNREEPYSQTSNNLIVGHVYKWSESGSAYDLESAMASDADFEEVLWSKDGSYGNGEITRDRARITGADDNATAIADNDTVYIHYEDDRMWTGYTNVASMDGIYGAAVLDDDEIVTVMFIEDSEGSAAEDDDFVYISDPKATETTVDGDTVYVYEDSYVNQDGSLVEGEFIASAELDIDVEGLYKVESRDSDDYATDVTLLVDAENNYAYDIEGENRNDMFYNYATRAQGGLLRVSGSNSDYSGSSSAEFSVNDSDTFYLVVELDSGNDSTDRVYQGDIGDIETDSNGLTAVYVLTVDDASDNTPLAEMVLVIVPDESTTTPGGSDPEDYESYVDGDTVHVVLVDQTNNRTNVANAASDALEDAGYTFESLDEYTAGDDSAELTATSSSGRTVYFNVEITQYWTVTVDNDDVYYAKNSESAEVDIDGEGTGYVINGEEYAEYGTYSEEMTAAVEIETGYYTTVSEEDIDVSAITNGSAEASNGTDEFVAVNDEITVTVTVPAGTVTGNDMVFALDVTGECEVTDAQTVSAEDNAEAVELTFEISNITDDITVIEVTAETVATTYDIAEPEIGDNEDSIIQSVAANKTSATEGESVQVTITLSGTVTATNGINLSVEGVTPTWGTNVPDGVDNADGILLENGSIFDGETIRFTFTMADDDVDNIVINATEAE